jgi:hypothetical protein
MKKTAPYVWLLILGFSCGGGSTFNHGFFQDRDEAFRVGILPTPWDRVDIEGQNDLAWYSHTFQSTIQVNCSCDPEMDIPLEALTHHLLIGFTERKISEQRLANMDGREALRSLLSAKLDGVPRKMALAVLKKDGCVYDFSLIGPVDQRFSNALPHFESLLSGFHAERRP